MARKKITENPTVRSTSKRNKAEIKSPEKDAGSDLESEDEILQKVIKDVSRKTRKRSENGDANKTLTFAISDDDSDSSVESNKSPKRKQSSVTSEKLPTKKGSSLSPSKKHSAKKSSKESEEEQAELSDTDKENSVQKGKRKSIKDKHDSEDEDDENEISVEKGRHRSSSKSLRKKSKKVSVSDKDDSQNESDAETSKLSKSSKRSHSKRNSSIYVVRKSNRQSSTRSSKNDNEENFSRRSSKTSKESPSKNEQKDDDGEVEEDNEKESEQVIDNVEYPPKKKYTGPQLYEVEKIISHTGDGKNRYFQIRWKGYTEESDTWESITRLSCPKLIAEYYEEVTYFYLLKYMIQ